jgi:hypothetical protein
VRNPWLTQLLARRPFKVVAVALANKMARMASELLAHGGAYGGNLRVGSDGAMHGRSYPSNAQNVHLI